MDGDCGMLSSLPDHLRVRAERVRKELGSCLNDHEQQKNRYAWPPSDPKPGAFYKIRLQLIHNCNRLRRSTGQRLCKLLNWLTKDDTEINSENPTLSDQRLQQLLHEMQEDPIDDLDCGASDTSLPAFNNLDDLKLNRKRPTIADYAARFEYTAMVRHPPIESRPANKVDNVFDDDDPLMTAIGPEVGVWPNPAAEVQRLSEQLMQLERLLDDMQLAHQDRILREDMFTCRQNDRRRNLKAQAKSALDEMKDKSDRVQCELNQCKELLQRLKEEMRLVKQRRKALQKSSKKMGKKFDEAARLLRTSLQQKQAEMMNTQRRVQLRRQQDTALIRGYQLQKQQLKQQLAHQMHLESISCNNRSAAPSQPGNDLSDGGFTALAVSKRTVQAVEPKPNQEYNPSTDTSRPEKDDKKFEQDLQALRAQEDEPSTQKVAGPPMNSKPTIEAEPPSTSDSSKMESESEENLSSRTEDKNTSAGDNDDVSTITTQEDIKIRCLQQLHHNNRLCIRDTNLKMRANQGAKSISRLVLLPSVEGLQPLNQEAMPLSNVQLAELEDRLLRPHLNVDQVNDYLSESLNTSLETSINESLQVMLLAEGTLVNNAQLPMQIRLLRYRSGCPIGRRFEHESIHIIRHLLNRPHSSLVQQVELFRIEKETVEESVDLIRLYVHVEERCEYTLRQFVEADPVSLADLHTMAESMASALMHLHDMGVAHTALSTRSVFVTQDCIVKIGHIDRARMFYCSRSRRARLRPPTKHSPNSIEWTYAAPEVRAALVDKEKADRPEIDLAKADVYSYGLLLWYCSVRRDPTEDDDQNARLLADCLSNAHFRNLIQNCMRPRSAERLTIFSILCHSSFAVV